MMFRRPIPIRAGQRPDVFLFCLFALFLLSGCVRPYSATAPLAESPLKLGSVWIDPGRSELVMSGMVNQVEGAIELLACGPGGKTHESLFVLFVDPSDLQTGLFLLGLKHGPPMEGMGAGPPVGDPVSIAVEWEEGGKVRRANAGEFIRDVKTGEPADHAAWIFNGSKVEKGYFLARAEESLIASYWDPWAIINIKSALGADDERLAARKVAPLHTPVRMIISPAWR
jgi:hypothetical protein